MAIAPRNFPLPRGPLNHSLSSYFVNRIMSGSVELGSLAGFYAQAGVNNNATDGSILYVIGLSAWCNLANDAMGVFITDQLPPTFTVTQPTPLNPFHAPLAGQIISTSQAGATPGNQIWRLGGNAMPDHWPYDAPIAILPAGWTMYVSPLAVNELLGVAFRWIALAAGTIL